MTCIWSGCCVCWPLATLWYYYCQSWAAAASACCCCCCNLKFWGPCLMQFASCNWYQAGKLTNYASWGLANWLANTVEKVAQCGSKQGGENQSQAEKRRVIQNLCLALCRKFPGTARNSPDYLKYLHSKNICTTFPSVFCLHTLHCIDMELNATHFASTSLFCFMLGNLTAISTGYSRSSSASRRPRLYRVLALV